MSVFFTSDLHLGHSLAAYLRGFSKTSYFPTKDKFMHEGITVKDIQAHDDFIIETLTKQCYNKNFILWILGDVAMDKSGLYQLAQIPCKLRLVAGNHDLFKTTEYLDIFEEVRGVVKYKNMWLSHCPMHPQELYGRVNIHGHIHQNTDSPLLELPYFNVNWDFWSRALSLDEIRKQTSMEKTSSK